MTELKRNRSKAGEIETLAMANCLMLLSNVGSAVGRASGRVFTCKTCNREFNSFQALGGHRASHKKPRLKMSGDVNLQTSLVKKSRAHQCSICGQEFAIGQALGGHMRRHRVEKSEGLAESEISEVTEIMTPVLKKSSSGGKRVFSLDLNLTPFENYVKLDKTSAHPSWLKLGVIH